MGEKVNKVLRMLLWIFFAFLGFRFVQLVWFEREFWIFSTFILIMILISNWDKIKGED